MEGVWSKGLRRGGGCLYWRAIRQVKMDSGQNKYADLSDAELVVHAKAGELAAFEVLTSRYEGRIYSLAWRILRHEHDAEDITQQTFLSALENLQSFRQESGFGTWVLRIATNAALKVVRKRKGLPLVSLDEAVEGTEGGEHLPHPEYIADWRESPEQLVERNETRKFLEEALDQLEEKYRSVFLLRDVEGLSVQETGQALGLTESNVKVRLLRARLQLRELLTRRFGEPTKRLEPHKHS